MIDLIAGKVARGEKLNPNEQQEYQEWFFRNQTPLVIRPKMTASEAFQSLGSMTEGEFISPNIDSIAKIPTEAEFTGVAMSGDGYTFNDVVWHWVAVNSGVLQVGINYLGQLLAAGGEYIIDADGSFSDGLTFLHRFEATYNGVTRQAYLGMTVPDGQTQPAFRIYYNEPASSNLVSNGSFDAGDETSWTDTNTSWSVAADDDYGYAAQHDETDTGCPPTLTQSVAISASTVYAFEFASKFADGDFPPSVSLIWKDGGGTTLRTDVLIAGTSSAWVTKSSVYTSPSTAATVLISVHAGDIFTDCYVSGFVLNAVTSFSSIDFVDGMPVLNPVAGFYEQTSISTPDSGFGVAGFSTDNFLHTKNDLGVDGRVVISPAPTVNASATSGTGETVLATYTIPANMLSDNTIGVRITAAAEMAAGASTKTARVRFGGVGGTILGSLAGASANSFYFSGMVWRTGAATQESRGFVYNDASMYSPSPTQTLSSAVDIVLTGQTTDAAHTVSTPMLMVEYIQQVNG